MRWICNYNSPGEAEKRAQNMNELAAAGNYIFDCSFFRYFAGEPLIISPECEGMGGLYREPLADCACCGRPVKEHMRRTTQDDNPCGW